MNGRDLISKGSSLLNSAGVANPAREAMFILASLFDCEPAGCFLIDEIDGNTIERFEAIVERRLTGEPLQLILGKWEFYGRHIILRKGVFVPRPETEGLVDIVLERARREPESKGLEIGVGSGVICVNLLAEIPGLRMTGTDISKPALELTLENAEKLGVSDRLTLVATDCADGLSSTFDFIVSNPPYVLASEMMNLPAEVRFDPENALTDGGDDLETIRKIVKSANERLIPGGFLALEIHENMGDTVLEMLSAEFVQNRIIKDLAGKDRYCIAFKGS